ncbi:MAG: tRNA-specific adenosine deaminase [Azospirillum brasilense]|nr:MAG: tRNA-specific adenosine deaminase [Azospirillum brasilense]
MQSLIALARTAAERGEVPIAAAIVAGDGTVLAQAHNLVETHQDATQHAELIVLREAMRVRGSKYLQDCTLMVTLEPCAMCAQAASLAKVKKIIFGAYDPKGGGVEHGARVFSQPTCHHAPEVVGGVMEAECGQLLSDFFARKR